MLTNITNYLCDGANYTIQALMCLCKKIGANLDMPTEYAERMDIKNPYSRWNEPVLRVGRYENCREQGYTLSLVAQDCSTQIAHYTIFEHRNSDNICIQKFRGQFINTPSIDDIWKDRKDKWDIDQTFSYNEVWEAYEWLSEDIESEIAEFYAKRLEKFSEKS